MIKEKKAQVTIFIIVAVIIVASAAFGLVYFKQISPKPTKVQVIENYLLNCIDEKVKDATRIAGMQSGYLKLPEFEAGSAYNPFSNRLNFLGISVPYWFYVSGNNIFKSAKPSIELIESQFNGYIADEVKECDFNSFKEQGYSITFSDEPKASVKIGDDSVESTVDWHMTVAIDETKSVIGEHKVSTKTKFGKLYKTASKIFDAEQNTLFLENYSYDILNLYAPVTGLELSCAPKVWSKLQIQEELKKAAEANIASIKVRGTYYSLSNSDNRYFVTDIGENIDDNVHFFYSKDFPMRFDVWPSENNILTAEPIGKQAGLGILNAIGFCYVPYHFVYDMSFPVMIQINKGDEFFQFPVIVVIEKNEIRNSSVEETNEVNFDICNYKTQNALFYTYDENLKPLETEISYKCFNQICELGKTSLNNGKAILETKLPKCYNGFVIAEADGYKTAKLQVETIDSFSSNIFLQPVHNFSIEMPDVAGDENAIISFISKDYSFSVYYPEQKQIEIAEGNYNVSVNIFKESVINLESQTVEKCIKVPDKGIAGIFGIVHEECYDLEIPEQSLTNVLLGGGSSQFSVTDAELSNANKLIIKADKYDVPTNLIELSDIYTLLEISGVNIELK